MIRINADDLPRFMACNPSINMVASVPPSSEAIDNTVRDEGIAAHYMATAAFNNAFQLEEMVGRKAPNGVYMTEEMAEHVEDYLATLTMQHGLANFALRAMEVEADHETVSGRTDYAAFTNDGVLTIADFKYGWRIVNPEMNWTLISHAIAILHKLPMLPLSINFAIYQPRPYHSDGIFRTWVIDYQTLLDLRDQLYSALANPSDQLRTSNHCTKCRANGNCPAANSAGMNAIDVSETAFNDEIDNISLSKLLDTFIRAQDMLKSRIEALQELAKHRLRSGQVINNYSVEMALGNTRFKEVVTAEILKAMTGKDLVKSKLVTPAEAKRQGVNEEFLKMVTERPSTGLKLSRISANKKAEKLFKR